MTVDVVESDPTNAHAQLLARYTAEITWGEGVYNEANLELTTFEEDTMVRSAQGQTFRAIGKDLSVSTGEAKNNFDIALAKLEAQSGLDKPIESLSPRAQKFLILENMFPGDWQKHINIFKLDLNTLLERASNLDEVVGPDWRRLPRLLSSLPDRIRQHAEFDDELFGPEWRKSPIILTQAIETIRARAEIFDNWFGLEWRKRPKIITNHEETVLRSVRLLEALGIRQSNTSTSAYFNLLSTNNDRKREKAKFIREQILGHKQLYIWSGKISIRDVVEARRIQTPEQREQEQREIDEFRLFLAHAEPKRLVYSEQQIKAWAQANGYMSGNAIS